MLDILNYRAAQAPAVVEPSQNSDWVISSAASSRCAGLAVGGEATVQ